MKYSVDVSRDPAIGSPVAECLAIVDSVTVRDSMTAVVWFARRSPTQFYDLVYNMWIMPQHAVRRDCRRTAAHLGSRAPARRVGTLPLRAVGRRLTRRGRRGHGELPRPPEPRSRRSGRWHPTRHGAHARRRRARRTCSRPAHPPCSRSCRGDPVRVVPYPGSSTLHAHEPAPPPAARGAAPGARRAGRPPRAEHGGGSRGHAPQRVRHLGKRSDGPLPRAHPSADTTLPPCPTTTCAHGSSSIPRAGRRARDGVRQKGGRRLAFSILVPLVEQGAHGLCGPAAGGLPKRWAPTCASSRWTSRRSCRGCAHAASTRRCMRWRSTRTCPACGSTSGEGRRGGWAEHGQLPECRGGRGAGQRRRLVRSREGAAAHAARVRADDPGRARDLAVRRAAAGRAPPARAAYGVPCRRLVELARRLDHPRGERIPRDRIGVGAAGATVAGATTGATAGATTGATAVAR